MVETICLPLRTTALLISNDYGSTHIVKCIPKKIGFSDYISLTFGVSNGRGEEKSLKYPLSKIFLFQSGPKKVGLHQKEKNMACCLVLLSCGKYT